jgi:hypothetical protein
MKSSLAILAAAFAFGAAQAAPKAESAVECGIAADMAVVARSLAEEHVQRPKAIAIMTRIYDVSESDRGKELMKEILEAAYGKQAVTSQNFAEELFTTCIKDGGNMDAILGKRL